MSGMPHSTNPVAIAKETVAISKQVDSPAFQKVATWGLIASAAVTAAVSLLHAVRSIARDLAGKPESHGHNQKPARREPIEPAATAREATPHVEAASHERSWASRSKAEGRTPDGGHRGYGGRH